MLPTCCGLQYILGSLHKDGRPSRAFFFILKLIFNFPRSMSEQGLDDLLAADEVFCTGTAEP